MELQRMKLENVKHRIMDGEKVVGKRMQNGEYVLTMEKGPEITFDGNYRPTVENTIRKAKDEKRETF